MDRPAKSKLPTTPSRKGLCRTASIPGPLFSQIWFERRLSVGAAPHRHANDAGADRLMMVFSVEGWPYPRVSWGWRREFGAQRALPATSRAQTTQAMRQVLRQRSSADIVGGSAQSQ